MFIKYAINTIFIIIFSIILILGLFYIIIIHPIRKIDKMMEDEILNEEKYYLKNK